MSVVHRTSIVVLLCCGCLLADAGETEKAGGRLKSSTFAGLELRGIGPALMSGRISDVAKDPNDRATWYVAVSSGGCFVSGSHSSPGTITSPDLLVSGLTPPRPTPAR